VTAAAEGTMTLEQEILARPVEEREPARAFFAANPAGEGAPIAVVIPAYNGQGLIFMLGYWLAYKRGSEFIATTDADGQYNETEFDRVLEPILAGRADFVNGSRRLGTELTTDPVRHAGVIFFGAYISMLLRQRITDPASGIRAFRTIVTRTVKLEQTQYQTSELLVATAMNGFRIMEVATTMRDRPEGATLTKKGPNLLYGLRFARAITLTYLRELKRKRKGS